MNNKSILIIGAGGHAKVVFEIAKMMSFKVGAFLDEVPKSTSFLNIPLYSFDEAIERRLFPPSEYDVFVAIGNNSVRKKLFSKLITFGYKSLVLIHPKAAVSESSSIGHGTVIMPNAVVNYDATIGIGAIINSGAIIEHDCSIGEFSIINQGAILGGGSHVGKNSVIGAGVVIEKLVKLPDESNIQKS